MTLYKEILKAIANEARYNDWNCNDGESKGSCFTTAEISAYVRVLNMMGHDAEWGSWDDDGCDRFSYLKVDGMIFMRNSEFTAEFYEAIKD